MIPQSGAFISTENELRTVQDSSQLGALSEFKKRSMK